MINEVINSIIEAEKKAEEMVATAYARSKEILSDAEAKKLAIAQAVKERTKLQVKEILDAGEAEAESAALEVIGKGEAEASAQFVEGMEKSQEALSYIVGRMLSKYGTR